MDCEIWMCVFDETRNFHLDTSTTTIKNNL